jgi:hypothetical protein
MPRLKPRSFPPHGLIEEFADLRGGREGGAVVAGQDDQGAVVHADFLQQVEQAPHVGVDAGHLRRVGLLQGRPRLAGVGAQIIDFVAAVGEGDGVEEKEGAIPLLAHPGQRRVGDEVLGVGAPDALAIIAGQFDALGIIIQEGGKITVGVALTVVAEEAVEAHLEGTARGVEHAHAPLAEATGGVTGLFQQVGHGEGPLRQGQLPFRLALAIGPDGAVAHVQPGHERGPRGGADAGAAVGLGEPGAFGGQAVEARGLDELLPIAAQVALGEIVTKDEDEIRGRGGEAAGGQGQAQEDGEEAGGHGAALGGPWLSHKPVERNFPLGCSGPPQPGLLPIDRSGRDPTFLSTRPRN